MHNDLTLAEPTGEQISEARLLWIISLVSSLLILAFDLFTHSINPSILYLVPLALMSYSPDRNALWKSLLFLVPATYLGYFFVVRDPQFPRFADMINYRIINRSFVAVALVGVAGLMHLQRDVQLMIARQRIVDSGDDMSRILDAVNRIATISIAVVVTTAVCITDLFTPGNLNLPILFAIPLAFVTRIGSRRVLWSLACCLVVFAIVGFQLGPGPSGTPEIVRSVTTNRAIATVGILAVAAAMHPWIGRRRED